MAKILYNDKKEFTGTDPSQATPDEKWLDTDATEVKNVVNTNYDELTATTTKSNENETNIGLKANQTDLDNTEVKASSALSKANDNETAISNLPAEKTKTSELTNDGADSVNPFITALDLPPIQVVPTSTNQLSNNGEDGVNPFINATDLPDVSTFIEQEFYDETDVTFQDSKVTNLKMKMVKTGKIVTINAKFDLLHNNQNIIGFFIPAELAPDVTDNSIEDVMYTRSIGANQIYVQINKTSGLVGFNSITANSGSVVECIFNISYKTI